MTSPLAAVAHLAFDNPIKWLCRVQDLTRGIYGNLLGFEYCHVSFQRKISLRHDFHPMKVSREVGQMTACLTKYFQRLHWQRSFCLLRAQLPLIHNELPCSIKARRVVLRSSLEAHLHGLVCISRLPGPQYMAFGLGPPLGPV